VYDLVDTSKFRVEFETNVVNCLRAFRTDHGVFLEDNLSRNLVNGVAHGFDHGIDVTLFAPDDDHDHVRLSFLCELVKERNEIFLQASVIRLFDDRKFDGQPSFSSFVVQSVDKTLIVTVGKIKQTPMFELFPVVEVQLLSGTILHCPFAVSWVNLSFIFVLRIVI